MLGHMFYSKQLGLEPNWSRPPRRGLSQHEIAAFDRACARLKTIMDRARKPKDTSPTASAGPKT